MSQALSLRVRADAFPFLLLRLLSYANTIVWSEIRCKGKTKNVHKIKSSVLYNNILHIILFIYLPYIDKIRSFLQYNNLFLHNQPLLLGMCDAFVASQGMVCTRFKLRRSVLKTFEINIMEVVRNADWWAGEVSHDFE